MTDFGPDLGILNLSHAWHGDISHAFALLESRAKTACKIINAFEHDAPVEAMLDRYRIPFLHEAHGPNPKVMQIGRTPTQRAGKVNSESFRVVRFEGCKAVSFTYAGDKVAPIPLPRHEPSPMRLAFSPANDGSHRTVTARIDNEWQQDFPNSRVTFVMPKGEYKSRPRPHRIGYYERRFALRGSDSARRHPGKIRRDRDGQCSLNIIVAWQAG